MKLALLGLDAQMLAVAKAAAGGREHEVVAAWGVGDQISVVQSLFPGVKLTDHWAALLDGRLTEAVLVARGADDDLLADQLRKLVQEGMPLLLSHPLGQSMLVYYELDMIRRETGCVMLPYLPGRLSPAVGRMAEMVAGLSAPSGDSQIGAVEHIIFERTMPDRSRRSVLDQFARDVDLIRAVGGDVTKLAAMGSPGEAAYANLSVQVSGHTGVVRRWSVGPVEEAPGGRLTVTGTDGKAVLHMPDGSAAWRLELRAAEVRDETFPIHAATALLQQFSSAVRGAPVEPQWVHAAKAVELTETIDRSLAKGRTIELHDEEYTEAGTFKGTMTSLGCGLLLAALVVLFAAAIIQKLAEHAGLDGLAQLIGNWPYLLLVLLTVFLSMQALLHFARTKRGPRKE